MDVVTWLKGLGLGQYEPAFREHEIDERVLSSLTAEDLKDLGVASVGHRRLLLNAIAAISPATAVTLRPRDPPARTDAERRQLTVMFCDLVGSTELSVRLDPEDFGEVIAAYHRAVAEIVASFDGFVAKYLGDGVLACFGYPRAHEDDAERAVRSGLGLIDAVGRLDVRSVKLQGRVGIATGLVVVGGLIGEGPAQEQSVVGETPNLAARLQALAASGAVVIDAATRRLTGGLFEYADLEPASLRGIAAPVPAARVLRESAEASRFEALRAASTPFVGRDEELALLARRWRQARAGEGRVVLIAGEPGIGKSRIVQTLLERIADQTHTRLRCFCSPHHQDSALRPSIAQLECAAGFRRDDTAEQRREKLDLLLAHAMDNPGEAAPLIAELLSIRTTNRDPPLQLTPQMRKEKTLRALLAQLEGLAARQPVLMAFEDAHWSDPTSLELLDLIVDRAASLRLLLIITFRPEFAAPWTGRPQVSLLGLNHLGPRERSAIIAGVTGGKTLPAEVAEQIIDRTDGVPLFVEELTKTVLESGFLREEATCYVLNSPMGRFAIPMTLQASLLMRLDRLGTVREIAQEAAAIGREFDYSLLSAISRFGEPQLVAGLDQLVSAGLLRQRGVLPSATFSFKHALMQDVAYSTLVRGRRKALHARVAEAFEQRFRDIVETSPELLAQHLGRGGSAERSVEFWLKAARLSLARGAAVEAAAQLHRGLATLSDIPDIGNRRRHELEMQILLGNALAATTGYTGRETDAAFWRARELCLEIKDSVQLLRVAWGQYTSRFAGGRHRAALAVATEMLELAKQMENPAGSQMGHVCVGTSLLHLGSLTEARTHLERALSADPECEREWVHLYDQSGRVVALSYLGVNLALLDVPDQAEKFADQAVEEAATLSHPTSLCFAHSIASRVCYLLGKTDALARHAAMVVQLAEEHGLGLWQGLGKIYTGWALAGFGEFREAAHLVRDGIAGYRALGAGLSMPLYLATLAGMEGATDNHDTQFALLSEAQEALAATDEQWIAPELLRLTGEAILMKTDDSAAGETKLRTAFSLAGEHGAKLWQKRAAASLAALLGRGECNRHLPASSRPCIRHQSGPARQAL